ncbi:MAG: MATE family efflux transporter [Alkalibacterium sp.]|nr:MATE family efflux transporter [Alkalibacterium sp.]
MSLGTALVLSAVIYAGTNLSSEFIIQAFNTDQDAHIADMAARGLLIYFIGFFFAGLNTVLTSYFGATDQPNRALFFPCSEAALSSCPSSWRSVISTV